MTARMKLVVIAVAIAAIGVGATAQLVRPSEPSGIVAHPTDEQARADLHNLVELAKSGDASKLCSHGTSNCSRNVDTFTAMASVPKDAPKVVSSVDVPDRAGGYQGGRLLRVCGIDGNGDSYRRSLLFFGTDQRWTVIEAIYWKIGYSDSNIVPPSSEPSDTWASCPG
jgi:hypothetical protein